MTDSRLHLEPLPAAQTANRKRATFVRAGGSATLAAMLVFGVATHSGGGDGGLRLASATTKSVVKTLDEVGAIEPVSAAAVAFPVAGTVSSITVAPGATVTRGQTLATLDTTALQRAVDAAQAQVDQAKLALATALSANDTPVAAQDDSSSALDEARQAVLGAQQDVDAKLQAAQAALDSATQICAQPMEDSPDNVASCRAALDEVLAAQTDTSAAQSALRDASNALTALTNDASQETPRGSSNAPSTSSPSAADLAADQKAIDAALAGLAVAKQDFAAATVVSPIDGTIQAVSMAVGDAVTASSTSSVIKVIGTGGFEVTAIVAVDKLADVKLGQQATVKPDGTSRTLTGEVVAIGAPITSNGSTTYPVSIGVDKDDALRNGTVASVAITTASATSGVAVPTSAVHVEGERAFVNVVDGSKVAAQTVTVGVIGREWTQIKSGLSAGDKVVLADLSEALPGSATSSSNSTANEGKIEFGPRNFVGGGPAGSGPVTFGK